jgi:hypothetical protein
MDITIMNEDFKLGDKVYYKTLKQWGTFIGYVKGNHLEANVDFTDNNGQATMQKVPVSQLELNSIPKTRDTALMDKKQIALSNYNKAKQIYLMDVDDKEAWKDFCGTKKVCQSLGIKL